MESIDGMDMFGITGPIWTSELRVQYLEHLLAWL